MTENSASDLTLEEKASLTSGADFWTTKAIDRLGIPSVMMTDGPHGLRKQSGSTDHLGLASSVPATCFPPAVGIGSSFDPEIIERVGAAIGVEAAIENVAVVLGPGINIKRSPLCGRNFEYFSEDPIVSGILGAASVRGIQSKGVGTSLKHFAANNQEFDRMRASSDVDPRPLREIYLRGFVAGREGRGTLGPSCARTTSSTGLDLGGPVGCSPACCATTGASTASWSRTGEP